MELAGRPGRAIKNTPNAAMDYESYLRERPELVPVFLPAPHRNDRSECSDCRGVGGCSGQRVDCDSGQFAAIQRAAISALDDDSIPDAIHAKYERRLKKLVATLQSCGFQCSMPGGSYFLYTAAPVAAGDRQFDDAESASQCLITERSIVTVPWDDAGPFLRFSVTYEAVDEAAEDALMAETKSRLESLDLKFS